MSENPQPILPGWTTRRVIWATVLTLAVISGFWFLYHFRLIAFILFVAIIIGTAINPVVDWLQKRRVPPILGSIVIYVVLLALVLGFVLLLVPLIINQLTTIASQIPAYYQSLRDMMVNSGIRLLWRIGVQIPEQLPRLTTAPETAAVNGTEETIGTVVQALGYAKIVGWSVFTTLATLLLSFYWTLEGKRAVRAVLLIVPRPHREKTRELLEAAEMKVGAYVRGQTILCLLIGASSLVAYLLIGLPYALVLALVAGLLEAVPYLGPTLGAVPPLLLALSVDPSKVIWVVVATIIIQQLENNLFMPRVMNESVGVNPIVTLLSIAAFGSLLGIVGAVLAIPIAAMLQILLDHFVLGTEAMDPEIPKGRGTLSVIRYETQMLIQDLRKQVRQSDQELVPDDPTDGVEEDVEAIASTLDSILSEIGQGEATPS